MTFVSPLPPVNAAFSLILIGLSNFKCFGIILYAIFLLFAFLKACRYAHRLMAPMYLLILANLQVRSCVFDSCAIRGKSTENHLINLTSGEIARSLVPIFFKFFAVFVSQKQRCVFAGESMGCNETAQNNDSRKEHRASKKLYDDVSIHVRIRLFIRSCILSFDFYHVRFRGFVVSWFRGFVVSWFRGFVKILLMLAGKGPSIML